MTPIVGVLGRGVLRVSSSSSPGFGWLITIPIEHPKYTCALGARISSSLRETLHRLPPWFCFHTSSPSTWSSKHSWACGCTSPKSTPSSVDDSTTPALEGQNSGSIGNLCFQRNSRGAPRRRPQTARRKLRTETNVQRCSPHCPVA